MKNEEIVRALRRLKVETGSLVCMGCGLEHEAPITLCDDLAAAADLIEAQAKEIDALRNELCLKCGNYKLAHKGACNGCRWRR